MRESGQESRCWATVWKVSQKILGAYEQVGRTQFYGNGETMPNPETSRSKFNLNRNVTELPGRIIVQVSSGIINVVAWWCFLGAGYNSV